MSDLFPRLSIIVPYRDRQEHLRQFLKHMLAYFQRDKIDRNIPYRMTIVEQVAGKPFNVGKLCNVGFDLTRNLADYFCFHNVDYLPIWADYSYPKAPARLVWYGAEARPVRTGGQTFLRHNRDDFFGAVVMFQKEHFERVNGYDNDYWGWGFEDSDLRERVYAAGMEIDRRDGTFRPLDHDNAGLNEDLSYNEIARKNRTTYQRKKTLIHSSNGHPDCGLSTLDYKLIRRRSLKTPGGGTEGRVEMVTVEI